MAINQRFSAVDKTILISTGNSFMVCGSSTQADVNTSDLIKIDGTTTRDWAQSGSIASLNILSDSTVLFAELIWYSTVFSSVPGSLDLRSIENNPITFTTSKGTYQITPEYVDSYTGTSGTVYKYRSANVTSYAQVALSGDYSVSKVPISVPSTGLSNSSGGWSLSVVYRNNSFKPQKILYSSGISVATSSTPLQTTLTGFSTSSDPTLLKGSITMISANGEPLNGNEFVMVGPSFAQLINIGNSVLSPNPNPGTAPNNPGNSFFSGIINIADPLSESNGLLNINGTNGINNNDGFIPTQLVGARNKWDITNVDISNTLVTNQTLIAEQITSGSTGDGIQLVSMGTQVYSKSPNIITTLEPYDIDGDLEFNIEVGGAQIYAIKIRNDGDVAANNVIVSAILNAVTSFIPESITINGVNNPTANIVNGINVGTINARGIVTVLFTVRVNSLPSGGILYQNVNYSYQFISGLDTITNSGVTNTISLIVQEGKLTVTKLASKSSLTINDTVTYTITIQNTGTELAQDILFQDKMDSSCSFVPETVVINGTPYTDYNPVVGFNLPDMPVGSTNQIVFQAQVNSLPASSKISNICFVTFGYIFDQYEYLRKKTVISNTINITVEFISIIAERCNNNNNYPNVGDTVTYTLSLTNIGNISAINVPVLEPLIPGATFTSGSVKINGTSQPNLNPFEGFNLDSPILPLQTTKIEYKVLINSLNPENLIQNTANVPFKYQIIPGGTIISSQTDSNTVNTVANYVCINAVKSVNTAYSEIGNTLYYKIKISNTGNINAINTVFLDSLQSNLSFVASSVAINGIPYTAYDPTIGFTLGTICPNEIVEVTFQANINSRPNPNVLYNSGSLVYHYQPDPNGAILTNTSFTNTVQTIINEAQYSITKTVDTMFAHLNDYLVYTTTIENTGTVPLTNIEFADFIDIFLEFYEGTVYVNGINYPSYNPNEQFDIPDMSPGSTATIVFRVKVIGYPPIGYVSNMSEVTLTYKQNPDSPIITKTVYSNIVKTYIPIAKIDLVKTVDKLYSNIGDTLTYSFTATNNGNSTAINTFFLDILQSEATFVSGSILVNGVSKPDYNPSTGFTLGSVYMGEVVTVEFKVTVNAMPTPNTLKNNATTSYSYYVDPSEQPITNTSTSNIVTTIINSFSATLTKAVDKSYATIGDILGFTITATNTGTVTLTNVTFKDLIPTGATFVNGSVIIDGTPNQSFDPNLGFPISNVLPGGNVIVMFNATVTSVPIPPQIDNIASINFKYQLTPTSPILDGSLTSNTVTTNIGNVEVTNTKSVNKVYATINDTLTYTSVISNTGNVSLDITNFIDILDNHIIFIPGSVEINGVTNLSYNPNVGFTLGMINSGFIVTITFDVTLASLPLHGSVNNLSSLDYQYKIDPNKPYIVDNVTSNTVTTYINLGNLSITKAANRSIVRLTNIITYNFVISNTGNTLLQNLLFKDIIQLDSSFNTGTVYVNGINQSSYNPNTGFTLNNIAIGEQSTITFQVTVTSIPSNNELLNAGDITYSYYIDPNGTATTQTKTSNTTTVYVYDTILSANKTVDKAIAKLGENLSFTITLTNYGNNSAEHVVFQDILDTNLSFISDSVYINGVQNPGYNPNTGFNLDDIVADETVTISFLAIVISRPNNNTINNFATINYDYVVDSDTIYATINTTTTTYVAVGEVTIIKFASNSYATIGDNLNYTVIVKNTGSVNAINLIFQDLIPANTSFNAGTVVVNGVTKPTFDPNVGFTLSDLTPNTFHSISFSIHVDSLPQSGKVDNNANVTFTYKLTETDNPVTTTTHSNTVTTLIKIGVLTFTKEADSAYVTLGDTINYTITINNIGNSNCFDVFFRDIVQSNANFVTGSVRINGITYSDYNPNIGFNLNDIPGFGTSVVTFAVTVQSVPQDYIIYNLATGSFKYYVDPANPPIVSQGQSNIVQTMVNVGKIIPTKTASKSYATIDDILTYTVNIFNAGNTIAKNVNFRDVLPIGITFVTGSVTINGVSYPSYNPFNSFTLGNIISGDTVVVSFDAKVISIPTPSLVSNTANIVFSYTVNPNGPDIPVTIDSNTVTTQINLGSLNLSKTVDKFYVTMGNIITYTVIITNNGNVRADTVMFIDNLQSDITFNQGSVSINGTNHPDYDPNQGFSLDNIEPLNNVTIVFTATVIQNPVNSSILNHTTGTFSYKIDPNGQYYSKSINSNTVSTIIIIPSLTATKAVNNNYATLQDNLNYSILVKNNGNTTISQMFFADFLSNGAIFVAGTLKINGISYPTYDPIAGFNIPDLTSGNTTLVEFNSIVTSLPIPPQVTNYAVSNGIYYVDPQGPSYQITATSNTVTTNINIGSLSNIKSVDNMYAKTLDTVNYTSTITNTGTVNTTNLFFTDILQSALTFISGTVSINGVVYPLLNPVTGFELSDLAPGQTVTVGFSAKINSLPTPPFVTNISNIRFSYNIDPLGSIITKIQQSNTVTTNVVLGQIATVKTVDKTIATIGDELTYTITLTNVGNVVDSDVFFQDTPSSGVTFKTSSVTINNVSQPTFDPTVGFNLGDIGIGNVVTIVFVATVISVPSTNKVTNQAVITFKFVVDPKQPPYSDTTYSNTVTTNISYGNLSVTKAANKQFVTTSEQITYTITIVNIGNIDATNVVFLDPTPHNSTFVIGSVTINGIAYPDYNPSAGFSLNTMTPGQIITVLYKVQAINLC